ncbi:MAG: allantoate deiminase [Gammaproteobacteria bacterium]|jgi:allantoate deiminase
MNTIDEFAEQIMQRCEELGKISQSPGIVDRRYLSQEHKLANAAVAGWMQQANMHTWQDGAGNIWGRYKSTNPDAKSLIIGSHLDTVVNGGKYDGMLGVVSPIALIDMFYQKQQTFPFHIDIVGFGDEEGTRFGSTLLGSRALAGKWNKNWASLQDINGVSLRQAMLDFGLNFDDIHLSTVASSSVLAYIELHIEQGPVLEQQDLPVGIVTGIAGAKRLAVNIIGMAGHSGTVPMNMRQDALVGASEMILAVENIATEMGVAATVGKIENKPNAVNVISGKSYFSLDIRSDDDDLRDLALDKILKTFHDIATKRQLSLSTEINHSAPAVICNNTLISALIKATQSANIRPLKLLSGAGHDAMAMAEICPVGMLFTRCEKGISHHPGEAINTPDVASSLQVLTNFIENFTATIGSGSLK